MAPGSGRAPQSDSLHRKFYPEDVCRLKSDASFVGTVERTFYDVETHEPLRDRLIVSHAPVPERELMEFLQSGSPPKGYVFVQWSESMQGCSLVAEDDLDLVNRSLEIGYLVKRNPSDTMSGTVLSTKVKYTLQPIVYRSVDPRNGDRGPVQFTRPRGHDLEGDDGPPLIVDVDAEDVRVYDEFSEDDYIIYRQKLGIIHQVDRDAVILLSNQRVVTPLRPYALRCPVPSAYLKPIVSLPPDGPEQTSSSSEVWIPCMDLYPGQFVRTTQSNLRRRDWLPGSTSPNDIVEGYVLSTPPVEVHVDWLCSNVFSVNPPLRGPTGEIIRADSLRGEAIIYDDGKAPSGASQNNVRSTMYISAGDRVQFRDPAGAAVKYPAFDRIPDECTWGYDLNIFKVVSVKSEVVVQWQDQSITTEPSTSLHRFTGIENEVWPGEMVSLKEEIRTVPNPSEYAFGPLAFPLDHDNRIHANILQVKKVGIVQKVNSRERIASVRWYENPQVELLHEGHVLRTCSTLGKLGDEITEVSMYELTTHPSMVKTLGEMVLLVPEKVHQSHVTDTHYVHRLSTGAGPCVMSYIFPAQFDHVNMYLEYIKHVMVQQPWFEENVQIDRTPLPRHSVRRRDYNQNSPADWVGQIIALDLDGTITVRLGALDQVRDVKVPFERIMMVLDDDLGAVTEPEGLDDEYPEDEDETIFDRLASVVERSVEYEGGRPLNPEDEDDAMWSTEEEGSDVETVRSETEVGGTGVQRTDIDTTDTPSLIPDESEEKEARPTKPAEPAGDNNRAVGSPPSFAILESEPPEDHHFVNTPLSGSFTKRLRRLQTEYQILETSLPQGIYARTWESRMDLLRVVILGPQGTPYEYAPFVIDFHFGDQFPQHPPDTFFHSWTNGMGRINPNMYEDGKICLSILGTWPPKNPDENWSAERSTVLQILVSIMGLVLVKDPFYNEAGYEAFASEGDSRVESTQYTEKVFVMSRTFIKRALEIPVQGCEDVIEWHYLPGPVEEGAPPRPQLLQKAITEARAMIDHYNATFDKDDSAGAIEPASPFVKRLSLGAVVMLRKHLKALEEILAKHSRGS